MAALDGARDALPRRVLEPDQRQQGEVAVELGLLPLLGARGEGQHA